MVVVYMWGVGDWKCMGGEEVWGVSIGVAVYVRVCLNTSLLAFLFR